MTLDTHDFFQFLITCKRTTNANNVIQNVMQGKKRQKSFRRNYYIISPWAIIKAIIFIDFEKIWVFSFFLVLKPKLSAELNVFQTNTDSHWDPVCKALIDSIKFVFVETTQYLNNDPNVIYMQEDCGQHSSMTAGSKTWGLILLVYYLLQNIWMFLIS